MGPLAWVRIPFLLLPVVAVAVVDDCGRALNPPRTRAHRSERDERQERSCAAQRTAVQARRSRGAGHRPPAQVVRVAAW